MTPRGMMTVMAVLLCISLGLLSPTSAARSTRSIPCCTEYTRRPVPFQRIKGYREQTTMENCHIEAIIFYTVRKNVICATQKDAWVRKTLQLLSAKLKRLSKVGSAAGETMTKKSVNPSFTDGSGSFFNTTEVFPISTKSFY